MVPCDPTHGSSGSYRSQSPQSRRAARLARDSAAAAATLERCARLRRQSESAAPSSGNLRRVSELSRAGAAAQKDSSRARVCSVPAGGRNQLGGRQRRQTFRVTSVTSKWVEAHYSCCPLVCPSVNDGVGSSSS